MRIGIGASEGIAIGKVYIADEEEVLIDKSNIEANVIEDEVNALFDAIEKSKIQLKEIYERTIIRIGKIEAEIIGAHLMILDDPVFLDEIIFKIRNEHIKAQYAVIKTVDEQVAVFMTIDDPYIRERAADVRDVGGRIIKNLLGIPFKNISELSEDVILVGKDITPSQMAVVDRKHVKGIVSEIGGATSHTAILARNMGIPSILGAKDILKKVKDGQLISIDGSKGCAEFDIDENKLKALKEAIAKQEEIKTRLMELKNAKTVTKDGYHVEIAANIGKPEDTILAIESGAEGIGLFRTEFLYMDRDKMPDEEEQFMAYKQVVEGMKGNPVIIRTLDVGGDKEISYFKLPKEANPFLGYRAIRICLEETEMFKTQLRAILRASAYGKTRIMYPMIASLEEVQKANAILNETKEELRIKGQAFDESIEVGIMVEIPSAAVTADIIAKEVDFFSIGTNDLTQYTLAVDRINEKVSSIYRSFNPAVLRLIKNVIDASHKYEGKFTGMCGELAGNPKAALLLLGMGLDEFSMSPSSILKIRKIISVVTLDYAKKVAEEAMKLSTADEIEEYLENVLRGLGLDYLLEV